MISNNLSLLIINIFALFISKILEKLFKTPIIDNLRSCLHVLLLKLHLFELTNENFEFLHENSRLISYTRAVNYTRNALVWKSRYGKWGCFVEVDIVRLRPHLKWFYHWTLVDYIVTIIFGLLLETLINHEVSLNNLNYIVVNITISYFGIFDSNTAGKKSNYFTFGPKMKSNFVRLIKKYELIYFYISSYP